jgi:hypothetical protein
MSFNDDDVSFLSDDIRKHIAKVKSRNYQIFNFTFENMDTLSIEIVMLDNNSFRLLMKIYDYDATCNFINLGGPNIIFNDNFPSLEEAVRKLFSLKNDYKYSKVKDSLLRKDEIEYIERKSILLNKLCDDTLIESCCVCYEPNILLTSNCKHCLCRLCFHKIEYIKVESTDDDDEYMKNCPICRQYI